MSGDSLGTASCANTRVVHIVLGFVSHNGKAVKHICVSINPVFCCPLYADNTLYISL